MNAAPQSDSGRVPDPLESFRVKLLVILDGGDPALSAIERTWLAAFRVAASRSSTRLTRGESFDVCFDALARCRDKGKHDSYRYVLRACVNAHRNHLRAMKGKKGKAPEGGHDPWAGVDARLDIEDALVRLGKAYPTDERAIRLRRQGYTYAEIAGVLGVGAKKAERITKGAERVLGAFLGEAYAKP